jgi:hypothetical protein
MNHGELFPKAATRVTMAMALFVLLGAVGCMTPHQAFMSPAGDVMSLTAPPINPTEDRCSQFSCQP